MTGPSKPPPASPAPERGDTAIRVLGASRQHG